MANPVQQAVVERVTLLAEPLAGSLGLELVDLEYLREGQRWVLRIYIDKARVGDSVTEQPVRVSLEDCSTFSHALSAALDVEEISEAEYALEVSSPGIERPLKKPADFDRFAGQRVKVKTYAPLPPDAGPGAGLKSFTGKLVGLRENDIELALGAKGASVRIPLAAIAKAHLDPEL